MNKKGFYYYFFVLFVIFTGWGCHSGNSNIPVSIPPALLSYFTPVSPSDTLHFFFENDPSPSNAKEIPLPILYEALDSTLHREIGYDSEGTEITAWAHNLFPIDEHYDAALLEIQEFWYEFKYLLLFSKASNQFTGIIPVNEFYGGDGGQIRSESWLFFENTPKLLTRFSEHYLDMSAVGAGGDPKDLYAESVRLQEWQGSDFIDVPVRDSSRWIKDFVVKWE